MLAQPTERRKLDTAIQLWASVYVLQVERALQVLIELIESPIRPMTQITLEPHPIPREIGRPHRHWGRGLVPTQRPGEQSRGVCDVVVGVCANDEAIELVARHA